MGDIFSVGGNKGRCYGSLYKSLTVEICENGVIKAGVNGSGVKFGPALLRRIRYVRDGKCRDASSNTDS